jgi:hypothetical protein
MTAAAPRSAMALWHLRVSYATSAVTLLIRRDLVESMRQHRCIPGIAPCDLDCSNFQILFVDTDVVLAPDASLGAAMLAGIPFAFPFDLDPCAVDKQVQPALRAAIWSAHRKCILASTDGAEVRHVLIEAGQPKQAFYKARRLT